MLIPLAFVLGRLTATPDAIAPDEVPLVALECPEAASVCTSTAGLCPCPKPRKKRKNSRRIKRKDTGKVVTPDFERPDPTAQTAAYLKRQVKRLSACAPSGGSRQRVHLEVTVAPSGAIEAVKVTNLDPLPIDVSTCVEREMKGLTPPGFDATASETFGLTAVL